MLIRIFQQIGIIFFGIYCVYHFFNGENGVLAYMHIKKNLIRNQQTLELLESTKDKLERHVDLMSAKHICKDLLEEQVRKVIHYSHPKDLLVVDA